LQVRVLPIDEGETCSILRMGSSALFPQIGWGDMAKKQVHPLLIETSCVYLEEPIDSIQVNDIQDELLEACIPYTMCFKWKWSPSAPPTEYSWLRYTREGVPVVKNWRGSYNIPVYELENDLKDCPEDQHWLLLPSLQGKISAYHSFSYCPSMDGQKVFANTYRTRKLLKQTLPEKVYYYDNKEHPGFTDWDCGDLDPNITTWFW